MLISSFSHVQTQSILIFSVCQRSDDTDHHYDLYSLHKSFQSGHSKFSELNTTTDEKSHGKMEVNAGKGGDVKSRKSAWEFPKGGQKDAGNEKTDCPDVEIENGKDNEKVIQDCLPPLCVKCR